MASSSKTVYRSARSGRFVKASTASRHPGRTVAEANGGRNAGRSKAYRSATTGRYVQAATAARNPSGTVTENG